MIWWQSSDHRGRTVLLLSGVRSVFSSWRGYQQMRTCGTGVPIRVTELNVHPVTLLCSTNLLLFLQEHQHISFVFIAILLQILLEKEMDTTHC